MNRLFPSVAALAALGIFTGCGSGDDDAPAAFSSENPVIQTVNYPLAYFAERIVGDHAEVVFAAPADGDPAFWKPSDAELSAFQKADLIILNGADYAKWTKTASLPGGRTVDTSAGFADRFITFEETTSHSHGKGGDEHAHQGTAFTTWIDFSLAKLQAQAIADALAERLPEKAEDFKANAAKLIADIDALHINMESLSAKIGDQPLFASHPVYQYWSRAYGLNVKAVHWEPEVIPDLKALNELVKKSVDHDARWMIWEGEPDPASVEKLQQRNMGSLIFDPCGNRPDGEADWLSVMRQNIDNLAAVFGGSGPVQN